MKNPLSFFTSFKSIAMNLIHPIPLIGFIYFISVGAYDTLAYPYSSHFDTKKEISFPFVDIVENSVIANYAQFSTIYVDIDASGLDDGNSWMNAYTDLQDAIDAATSGDEIWVAEGTYNPTKDDNGSSSPSNNRNKTFYIDKNIQIYGGFDGSEVSRSQRDHTTHVTTLSGNSTNSYHVIHTKNVGSLCQLDGFTITDGNANGNGDNGNGGGWYNDGSGNGNSSHPTISNCIFIQNNAKSGAALYNDGDKGNAAPQITNCTFMDNDADTYGGAMYNNGTDGNSSPSVTNCLFMDNSATYGGAIYNEGFRTANASEASPSFVNCTFFNNIASSNFGHQIYSTALNQGTSFTTVSNCIIWSDRSGYSGLELGAANASIGLKNSILFDNNINGTVTGSFDNLGNNLDSDPLFVSATDLSLQPCSPAVDAGAALGATTDILGNNRPAQNAHDIGAYELQSGSCVKPFITRWDLSKPSTINGDNNDRISFKTETSGSASYSWKEMSGGGASGSGTLSNDVVITSLPKDAMIELTIQPENLLRFFTTNQSKTNKRLIEVKQWGTVQWTSMSEAFDGCDNLEVTAMDIPDLSLVTNMYEMFAGCASLTGPPNIGSWKVDNVTSMESMFRFASNFNQPLSDWNVDNVRNMASMFNGAINFDESLNDWNVENVRNMASMFFGAKNFNQPLNDWNVDNVTNMGSMFDRARSFNQPLSDWKVDKVTNMRGMFSGAINFNQPLNDWKVDNVTSMGDMFIGARKFNQPLNDWKVDNVTNMGAMFNGASSFNQNLGEWGSRLNENVIFNGLFSGFLSNSGLSVSNYDSTLIGFSQTTAMGKTMDATGLQYCGGAAARDTLTMNRDWTIIGDSQVALGITGRDTTLTCGTHTFNLADLIDGDFLGSVQYGSTFGSYTDTITMDVTVSGDTTFYVRDSVGVTCVDTARVDIVMESCGRPFITRWDLKKEKHLGGDNIKFSLGTSGLVSYSWTTVPGGSISGSGMTSGPTLDISLPRDSTIDLTIEASNLESVRLGSDLTGRALIDVLQWGDVEWKSMHRAFSGCISLDTLSAVDVPDLSMVTNMSSMFNNARAFKGSDLMNMWDVSNVTDMAFMFDGASNFNQPLSAWKVDNVTNMRRMFSEAKRFNQPLSDWKVDNVRNMSRMFDRAINFNQPLSAWNVDNVTSMGNMFFGARSFNQPLNDWKVDNVTNMGAMFRGASSFNQPLSDWKVDNVMNMDDMFNGASSFNQNLGEWGSRLNENVIFDDDFGFLSNSGLSVSNYDSTLIGFSQTTAMGRAMDATGLQYCGGAAARDTLIMNRGWTFIGDSQVALGITGRDTTLTCGTHTFNLADLIDGDFLGSVQYGSTFGSYTDTITMDVTVSGDTTFFVRDSVGVTCVDTARVNVRFATGTDLFISEYIEGSSSNKVFEIYNPTALPIDLSNYKIYRYNNGSAYPTDSLFLFGILLPGQVYVVGNPSAIMTILAQSDTLHTMTFYNGDDAIQLVKKSPFQVLDLIGEIGVDPGAGWTVGSGATNNFTLVRKASIDNGNTNWNIAKSEWDVFPIDMVDSLGFHNISTNCICPISITGRDTTLTCGTHTFNLASLIDGEFLGSVQYGSTFGTYSDTITMDVTVSGDTTFFVRDSVGVTCVDTAMIRIETPTNGINNSPYPPLEISIDSVSGYSGQTVDVSIKAGSNFQNITQLGWTITFDPSILSWNSMQNWGLTSPNGAMFTDDGGGKVSFSWSNLITIGSSLSEGDEIFAMRFNIIGAANSCSEINLNSCPTNLFWANGFGWSGDNFNIDKPGTVCVNECDISITGRDTTLTCGSHTFNLASLIDGEFLGSVQYGSTFGSYTDTITMDVTVSGDTTFFVRDSVGVTCVDTARVDIRFLPDLVWYEDADADGYTTGKDSTSCAQPDGYVSINDLTGYTCSEPFSDGFESADLSGWSATSPFKSDVSKSTGCSGSSDVRQSFEGISPHTGMYFYGDNKWGDCTDHIQLFQDITLPENAIANLSLYWIVKASNAGVRDVGVKISIKPQSASSFTVLYDGEEVDLNNAPVEWRHLEVYLSQYAGGSSQVKIEFKHGQTTPITYGLDDAKIEVCGGDLDCNDMDNTINPMATETCNGVDENCDGDTDEGIICCTLDVAQIDTFKYTGAVQKYVVPAGVTSVNLEAWGAEGANSDDRLVTNAQGGLGGYSKGILNVLPGDTLYIYVGGKGNIDGTGGYNGGGAGGLSSAGYLCSGGYAGGGGGASDVRHGGFGLMERKIIGGGGGGSGRDYCNGICQPCGCGGSGGDGDIIGANGNAAFNCGFQYGGRGINYGGGGTQTSGGQGGRSDNENNIGSDGQFGIGGNGTNGTQGVAGGGGGGGYYGGGGGGGANNGNGTAGGGGGGGSSYIDGLTAASTMKGIRTGNGLVVISVLATSESTTWYQDLDGDTYGNPSVSKDSCAMPIGYVADNTDCNDNPLMNGANEYPGAIDIPNDGIDQDCSGADSVSADLAIMGSSVVCPGQADEMYTIEGGRAGATYSWMMEGTGLIIRSGLEADELMMGFENTPINARLIVTELANNQSEMDTLDIISAPPVICNLSNCVDSSHLSTGVLISQTVPDKFHADRVITSDAVVFNKDFEFRAGESIEFQSGFTVVEGRQLLAEIMPCVNAGSITDDNVQFLLKKIEKYQKDKKGLQKNGCTLDLDNDNICDDVDPCIDIDGDGYGIGGGCAGADCYDDDASIPANDRDCDGAGTSVDCDDSDPFIGKCDADDDGIRDDRDNCPDHPNPGQEDYDRNGKGDECDQIEYRCGSARCNDGNPCTVNDQWDEDCNCVGTYEDSDRDGVCDYYDECEGYDDTRDWDGDNTPDGCDPDPACTDCERDEEGKVTLCWIPQSSDNMKTVKGDCEYLQKFFDEEGRIRGKSQCGPCECEMIGDTDSDGDGVCDRRDECPANPELTKKTECGCELLTDTCDDDGDGIRDNEDNCPQTPNPYQEDGDGDGIGDVCDEYDCVTGSPCDDGDVCTENDTYDAECHCVGIERDDDNDGVCNVLDQCHGYKDYEDEDGDGIPNGCDVQEECGSCQPDDRGFIIVCKLTIDRKDFVNIRGKCSDLNFIFDEYGDFKSDLYSCGPCECEMIGDTDSDGDGICDSKQD